MTERFQLGNLLIDRRAYEVSVAGERIELTFYEFEILLHLAENAGAVVARRQLLAGVWGEEQSGHVQKLTVHISRLRRKLAQAAPWCIETVPKRGYMLSDRQQLGTGAPLSS